MSTSAAINLITGINRSGKTLFTLQHIEKIRKKEGRTVYYYGIPGIEEAGVLTSWIKLQDYDKNDPQLSKLQDPASLHKLPNGAIVVLDESHRSFPVRKVNSEPPPYVMDFDQCGHRGHTFFFITQDAQDLDLFIRRRVGKHHHMVRAFGLDRSARWEWDRAANPRSKTDEGEAQKHEFRYPKEVYSWYKSSDEHTIKKSLPVKWLTIIAVGPILAALAGWYAWKSLGSGVVEEKPVQVQQQTAPVAAPVPPRPKNLQEVRTEVEGEGLQWAAKYLERAEGFPMSARAFDASYQIKAAPRISGCMDIRGDFEKCICTTQQGSIIETISARQCRHYVKNGWFDPTKPDDSERRDTIAMPPQPGLGQVAAAPPVADGR